MAIKQPSDKSHFILPDLGEGVHEAELIKWRVEPGQVVEEHDTLAEMETDKALVEVPSPWAGTIGELKGNAGDIINVGDILLTYQTADSEATSSTAPARKDQQAGAVRTGKAAADHAEPAMESEDTSTDNEREDAGTVVGSMSGELTISQRFARRPEGNGQQAPARSLATPAVRRIAREAGVDINRVEGSGRGGRVTAGDVENFVEESGAPPPRAGRQGDRADHPIAKPQAAISADGVSERIPFRGVRRKIAQALHHSVQTTVHFTVVDEADVTALDRKRKEYAHVLGRKLSFLPFIMAAVCRGLREHPALNANVDDEKDEILLKGVINLGCAVDTDHGLMVPVINNADQLSLVQLGDAVAEAAKGSRNRSIERERLTGGTFTISNVGSYGGMFATPIINYPEVAILAAGRVYEKVLTEVGRFYAGKVLPLSLSCDHRVVDGAEGTRFLNTVVNLLQSPDELIG